MTASQTILDLDVKRILASVERRYGLKLPRKVTAIDLGERGDLYIRFQHAENPVGEPTTDGLVVLFSNGGRLVAIEILDVSQLG